MSVAERLRQVIRPILVAARHVLFKPYTYKYPYEEVPTLPSENYKFDPKLGIAFPGFKGRHLLILEKCTGCSLCDIACQNISEAITMVYAFDIVVEAEERYFAGLASGKSVLAELLSVVEEGLVRPLVSQPQARGGSHPTLGYVTDAKQVSKADGVVKIQLNADPIWEHNTSTLYDNYLEESFRTLTARGWSIRITEDKFPESMYLEAQKGDAVFKIAVSKRDLKYPQNKKSYFPQVDYGRCVFCGFCVDPTTPVIVNPSLKTIAEIEVGDKVLTHTGEYKTVTKLWEMFYTGPLYRIEVYGHPDPLICTADHPILAVCRPPSSKKDKRLLCVKEPLGFILPNQLKPGDYVVLPIPKKTVELSAYTQPIRLYKNGCVQEVLRITNEPDLHRLIGYYLAEGFCDGGGEVNFAFGAHETEVIEDCKALILRYFNKHCKEEKNTGRGVRLAVHGVRVFHFFKQFGRGAHNKRVPDWVFFADPIRQIQLIRGLWLGDGCLVSQPSQKYLNVTTTSKTLAYQLQLILARLGVVGLVERQSPEGRRPVYQVNVFGRYAVELADKMNVEIGYHPTKFVDKFHVTENYVYFPIRRIEQYHVANYRVMDVTVADDHTFVPAGVTTSNCVDACPFYALEMTPDIELSSISRQGLVYNPITLSGPKISTNPPSTNPIDALYGWLRSKLS